jgi:hypothetical protein
MSSTARDRCERVSVGEDRARQIQARDLEVFTDAEGVDVRGAVLRETVGGQDADPDQGRSSAVIATARKTPPYSPAPRRRSLPGSGFSAIPRGGGRFGETFRSASPSCGARPPSRGTVAAPLRGRRLRGRADSGRLRRDRTRPEETPSSCTARPHRSHQRARARRRAARRRDDRPSRPTRLVSYP